MNEGGFWNRAGRRSGGERPINIDVSPEVECNACQTKTAFGLLPQRITGEVAVKTCPGCYGVLFVQTGEHWMSAAEFVAGVDAR